MPSGKLRNHKRNPGGRPSNKERLDELYAEIGTLRQLLYHRKLQDETWHMVHRLLTLVNELDDLATPQQGASWQGPGHSTEQPLLPGVRLASDGADIDHPDGDGETNKGNRNLNHAGTYAAGLYKWLHNMVRQDIESVENRLIGREAPPRPRPPRRETSNSVKDHAAQ